MTKEDLQILQSLMEYIGSHEYKLDDEDDLGDLTRDAQDLLKMATQRLREVEGDED